jgi:hypothetical protein
VFLSNNSIKGLGAVFSCRDDKFFHTIQIKSSVAKVSRIKRLWIDFADF